MSVARTYVRGLTVGRKKAHNTAVLTKAMRRGNAFARLIPMSKQPPAASNSENR